MTFPWRKAKGKRFSQIVTNHKNGSSLMIETGFPASLADLFLKHRNRLNNSNTSNSNSNNSCSGNIVKRKKKKGIVTSPLVSPVSIPDSVPSQVSSNFPSPLRLSPVSQISVPSPSRDMVVYGELDDVIVKSGEGDDVRQVVDRKRVFVAVMMMFFVVILALGVKGFAVGIALSAFLLLSMECVGRRMGGLLGTFSSCLGGFLNRHKKLLVMLGGCCSREVEEPIGEAKLSSSKASLSYTLTRNTNIDLVSEIHVVQPSSDLVPASREVHCVKYEFEEKRVVEHVCGKGEAEVLEKKKQELQMYPSGLQHSDGDNRKATRKNKIGSKIKKIASKLKKQKKAKETRSDTSGPGIAEKTNLGDDWRDSEVPSDGESTLTQGSVNRRNMDDDRVNISDSMCPEDSSNSNTVVDEGRYRNGNLSSGGCLVFLVIVLAGLVSGRVLALVFALSWFLILKFRRDARLRCISNRC